jgi:hypothetical protein
MWNRDGAGVMLTTPKHGAVMMVRDDAPRIEPEIKEGRKARIGLRLGNPLSVLPSAHKGSNCFGVAPMRVFSLRRPPSDIKSLHGLRGRKHRRQLPPLPSLAACLPRDRTRCPEQGGTSRVSRESESQGHSGAWRKHGSGLATLGTGIH